MALSGGTLLGLYLTVMAVLIGGFFILRKKFRKEEGIDTGANAGANAAGGNARRPAAPVARRGALDRMRQGGGGGGAAEEDAAGGAGSDSDDDEDGDVPDGPIDPRDKKAMRKAEKAAARAARAQVRAQQEAADSHRKAKEDKYAAKREAREAEREAAEREAAALEAQRAEEQRKKDAAEFDEWKDMFTVSGSGSVGESENASEDLLEEFVQTIRQRKVVILDELGAQYHMKTPQVIERIQQMESAGRITGVFDDRGKFLHITLDEMDAITKWMNRRGRVTIEEIVAEANKIIDLNPTVDDSANEQLILEDEKEHKST